MTVEETRQILRILKTNYPQSFKGWTVEQSHDFLDLWAGAFVDEPVQLVAAAVKSIIYGDTREFAPNIGQVKNMISKLNEKDEMTEQDAWNLVLKAIRNGIYGSEEEFNKLPPILQRLVGSPSQLRSWALLGSDEIHTVLSSNFMRSYRARAKHEKEFAAIPLEVKQALGIECLADKMRLGNDEN